VDAADRAAWREADRLFAELAELDPAQRAERLSAMALADDVRAHLMQLLASDEQQHAWLDGDARPLAQWTSAALAQAPAAMHGRRFGVWEIEDELGRGGMAVIYRARRVDGVADQVAAFKLLTVATLSRSGEHQFRREIDILARLAHPHIVGLLDAGIADDGTPWLAMPLVEGVHIDDWCERQALDTRQVVNLLLQVAAAVAAAHRSLVIHCDLKPSNVLVDIHGQVRLLDFGIARLAGQIGEATRTHWRALTPHYAAPEQFTDAPPTTAMDIHGLGALLYRLLTGQPPRTAAQSAEITLPSRVASRNDVIGVRHQRALRDDLDRVLLKSLATDPAQRYGTVDELAADLRRWLLARPVLATAPGRAYRARKFIARHRLGVAASATVLLAVTAGVGGTLWQAHQTQLQAERTTAIKDFVLDLLSAANPDIAHGKDPPASLLLSTGAERVRSEFATRPALRAEILATIGKAQLERGLLDAAGNSLDDAIAAFALGSEVTAARAAAIGDRAMLAYERGDPVDALRRLRQADRMAVAAGLAATDPVRLYLQVRSAEMQVETDRSADAEVTARSALQRIEDAGATDAPIYPDALCVLATSLRHQDRDEVALDVLLEAEAAQQRIAPAHPKMAVILNDLGLLLHRLGRYREAEATLQRAIERHKAIYGPMHPQTLQVMANRASLLRVWNGPAASAREYERLLPLVEQALGKAPHSQRVNMLGQLAVARDEAGERDAALQAAREAWAMQNALPAEQRERTDWVAGILGVMLFERDDPAAAELLARYLPRNCNALEQRTPFTRHVCIAHAWWAADSGDTCSVPPAHAPDATGLSANERDWWLAWWLLHTRCRVGDTAAVDTAVTALGEGRPLPRWLATEVHRQRSADR
jgi:serine/threonine-protein kinase